MICICQACKKTGARPTPDYDTCAHCGELVRWLNKEDALAEILEIMHQLLTNQKDPSD